MRSLNETRLEIKRYWSMNYSPSTATRFAEGELVHTLQDAMNESVRRRLPPSQMAALYLSGGLGSTAIAAARARYTANFPASPLALMMTRIQNPHSLDVLLN